MNYGALGVEIRPSFLPFTPWTQRGDLVDIFDFVALHDLIDNVDAVQYAIRLLIPPGSLLLDLDDATLRSALGRFDADALSYTWRSPDPALDELQEELAGLIEEQEREAGAVASETYEAVRSLTFSVFERTDPGRPIARSRSVRPRSCGRPNRGVVLLRGADPRGDRRGGARHDVRRATGHPVGFNRDRTRRRARMGEFRRPR